MFFFSLYATNVSIQVSTQKDRLTLVGSHSYHKICSHKAAEGEKRLQRNIFNFLPALGQHKFGTA